MARSSNQNNLDRLTRQHLAPALRFATRLTGRADEAEEIVQDALLRVARSWGSFRGEAEFKTWLFRIVINVFRDRLSRKEFAAAPLPAEVAESRDGDPATNSQQIELGQLIAARVSSLPPRQREVMVLTAFEGLTPREVAGLLAISEANVHATLAVARERLRRELAPYFAER